MAGLQLFTSDRRGRKGSFHKFLCFLRLRRSNLSASSTNRERKKRVHRKDRIIHVETTVEVMEEQIDNNARLGISNGTRKNTTTQAGKAMKTTTTIIGGAENIRKHDEEMEKQAETRIELERPKTLVNKISVSKMYDGFLEGTMNAKVTVQLRTDSIYNPVNVYPFQSANNGDEVKATKFEKVQDSMWKLGASVDRAIDATQRVIERSNLLNISPPTSHAGGTETEFERDEFYFHNPPHIHPQHDNIAPGRVSNVTESIYRAVTRRHARPTILPPNYSRKYGTKGIEFVEGWKATSGAVDWEQGEYFIAATTSQLKELSRDTIDRVRVVKAYIGPPTTPAPETTQADKDGDKTAERDDDKGFALDPNRCLINMTPEQIMSYADFTPIEFNPCTVHKDLAKHLGIRNTGIQVLGTNLPDTYSSPGNLSSYYGIPFVESAEQFNSNYTFEKNDDNDKASVMSLSISPHHEQTENNFYPIHTQPPSHSIILYLTGRGLDMPAIAQVLSLLDEKFVYHWDSRWFNGFRIPDHWEFNDETVEKVKLKCKAEEQWWQAELDRSGKTIPRELRVLRERMRTRKATYFVKKVVENYMWWRCKMGEVYHKDLLKM